MVISTDATFRFSACPNHSYREFMTGFQDFVEHAEESGNRNDFRKRVSTAETVSLWQSLAYNPNQRAAY